MRRLVPKLLAVIIVAGGILAVAGGGHADEGAVWPAGEGQFSKFREPLTQIFKFSIERGELRIDRDAWEARAKEIEKEDAAEAAAREQKLAREAETNPRVKAQLEFQRRVEESEKRLEEQRRVRRAMQLARIGPPPPLPPLFALFRRVQEQAHEGSSSFRGGGREPGYRSHSDWHEWDSGFEGETVAGELRVNNDAEELLFREKTPPNRRLEFRTDNGPGFSLEISKPNGDLIFLRQARDGQFSAVAIANGQSFVGRSASFLGLLKEHRGPLLNQSVDVLSGIGLHWLAAMDDARLRDAVMGVLSRTPEELTAGQDLLSDLKSGDDNMRSGASLLLYSRYNLLIDLIHENALSISTPADVKSALERVIADRREPRAIGDTLAVLDLPNDPRYLVSLLEGSDPKEYLTIVRRLKEITGQKPGNDAAAWQKWAASPREPLAPPAEAKEPTAWKASPLLESGELLLFREPLSELFQFQIKGGVLNFKPRLVPYYAFSKVEEQAKARSQGFGSGGGGGMGEWSASFTGDTLRGRIETWHEPAELAFTEMQLPKRTLEFRSESPTHFRLRLSNIEGDLISLEQADNGRFSIVALVGESVFVDQAKTFLEFFRRHRAFMESDVLPLLAMFRCSPIASTDSVGVRATVLASFLPADLVKDEVSRLLTDLDSDDYHTREEASKQLSRRYCMCKSAIQDKLKDQSASVEVQARLERLVAGQDHTPIAERTVAALDLTNDAGYLVSLFDEVISAERPALIKRLQQITGKTFGDDTAAWKEWAATKSE